MKDPGYGVEYGGASMRTVRLPAGHTNTLERDIAVRLGTRIALNRINDVGLDPAMRKKIDKLWQINTQLSL